MYPRNSPAMWESGRESECIIHAPTYITYTDEYLCDPGKEKDLLSINRKDEPSTKSLERLRQDSHKFKATSATECEFHLGLSYKTPKTRLGRCLSRKRHLLPSP